jgi:hypothetical protein
MRQAATPQVRTTKYFVFKGYMRCGVCGASVPAEIAERLSLLPLYKKASACKGTRQSVIGKRRWRIKIKEH